MYEAQAYRDRAARALLKAQSMKEPELRATFKTLAAGYESLARDAERLGEDARADEANLRQAGEERPHVRAV